jgi:hypothetical protein
LSPQFNNSADGRARALNDWLAAENVVIGDYV